jgi:SSS family solute:Na+ symporter
MIVMGRGVWGLVGLGVYVIGVIWLSEGAHRRAQATTEDYFVAGRSVPALMMIGTIALSIWSALAFYGWPGATYRAGIGYLAGAAGGCVMGVWAVLIMYKLWLLGKQYGYVTPGDFMVDRYCSPLFRWITSLICVIFIVPYISAQIIGASSGIEVASAGSVSFWLAAGILSVVMVWHVLWGGARSIAFADTLAGFAGVFITVAIIWFVLSANFQGGLQEIASKVMSHSPEVLSHSGVYASGVGVLGISVSAGIAIIAWPHIFVRSYFAFSKQTFRVMAWVFPLLEMFMFSCFVIQGSYLGRALYGPGLDPRTTDILLPKMVSEHSPFLFSILVVIGVYAYAMSTADSQLLVSSSILQKDIYDQLKPGANESERLRFARIWILVMMLAVLIVVTFRPALLVNYAYAFSSPAFAQLLPPLLGGLYWRRATKEGAIAGTVIGLVAVLVTQFIKNPIPVVHPVLWGLLLNICAYILISCVTPPPPQEVIEKIHIFLDKKIWEED